MNLIYLFSILSCLTNLQAMTDSPKINIVVTNDKEQCIAFENFPTDQNIEFHYSLPSIGKDERFVKNCSLKFDEKGLLSVNGIIQEHFKPLVVMSNCLPGERIWLRFTYPNGKIIAETSYIPSPIRAESKHSDFAFEAELLSRVPTIYKLMIAGLNENEKYKFESYSEGEKLDHVITFGEFAEISYSPEVIGLKKGKAKVKITRATNEFLSLTMDWGNCFIKKYTKN